MANPDCRQQEMILQTALTLATLNEQGKLSIQSSDVFSMLNIQGDAQKRINIDDLTTDLNEVYDTVKLWIRVIQCTSCLWSL